MDYQRTSTELNPDQKQSFQFQLLMLSLYDDTAVRISKSLNTAFYFF